MSASAAFVPGDRNVRVGIAGFGFAAQTFHVPLLRATPGYGIAAVASSRPGAVAAAFADATPGGDRVTIVPDVAALAREDVDLIVVCTPNDTHAAFAESALRAGKHVVVDKPFALTVAEARRVTATARRHGRVLSVFANRRWDSDFLTVREALDADALGAVAAFESRIDRYRPAVRDRWREGDGPGAGLLYDLGPHLVDQTLALFGVPDRVQAALAIRRRGGRSIDDVRLTLRYPTLTASLSAGMLVAGGSARFVVHGERATLVKQHADVQEAQLRDGMTPGADGWGIDPDDARIIDGASGAERAMPAVAGDQRAYYARLRDALRGCGPNPVTPEQATAVVAILEAAMRSDTGGGVRPDVADGERASWVTFGRPFPDGA